MVYFELKDDVNIPKRWWLESPRDAHGKEIRPDYFTIAQRLNVATPLVIPLQSDGKPLDFTVGAFDIPVVNHRTLNLLDEFAVDTFQQFNATIENHAGSYAVINFLESRKCLNESQSEFIKWTKHDHRADKAGRYRQITKLRIDPKLIEGSEIFRLWGWETLIVSERIKCMFIEHKISGVAFVEV